MKKVIWLLLGLIFTNLVMQRVAYAQDDSRFLDIIGLFVAIILTINISLEIGTLAIIKGTLFFRNKDKSKISKLEPLLLNADKISIVLLIGLQILGHVLSYNYQSNLLINRGLNTETVIIDKQWDYNKGSSGYRVYYTYRYKNKIYKHDSANDSLNIGDIIIVRFLADNPDNHMIMKKNHR